MALVCEAQFECQPGQVAVTGSQPLERSARAKAPSVPGDRRAGDRVEDAAEMVG